MNDCFSEIKMKYEMAASEMLRIHREMLDICTMDFSDRDAAWFYTWISEWFNTIKQYWPFDDISYLLNLIEKMQTQLADYRRK